jgi:hypothetical protein
VSFVGFSSQTTNNSKLLKIPLEQLCLMQILMTGPFQSEVGTTTGIENCYVVQRYQGIEIF